jgi:NADH-quinone oxidoreductase subunit J
VMVLYVFVVAYVGGGEEPTTGVAGGAHRHGGALKVIGPLFGSALAVELCIALLGTALKGVSTKGAPYVSGFGTPKHIGTLFLTSYLFPFEVASLLLLVAAIGAVVLARRRRGLEPTEADEALIRVARPQFTGTMHESTGIRAGGGTTTQAEAESQTEPIGARAAGPGDGRSEGGW